MYGFLFGAAPGVDSYSRHFGAINQYQNSEQNLSWKCLLLISIYTSSKIYGHIVNPGFWMTVGEDSDQYRKSKKQSFLAAAILLFIGNLMAPLESFRISFSWSSIRCP